jgi:hypothetical protein
VIFEFKPSFDRAIKSLPAKRKAIIIQTCLDFLESLGSQAPLPAGFGLKRLQDEYWEIRHGLHNHILFRWRDDLIVFILAGDHDSIKQFLKKS